MKRNKLRVHWIIWPVLALAALGFVVPWLWPQPMPATPAVQASNIPSRPNSTEAKAPPEDPPTTGPMEQPVTLIPMSGRLADQSAEISGLAWYGDYLMLLPQYPRHATGGGEGYIYALRKADILDFLDGKSSATLDPITIRFDAYGLRDRMTNFQGFESIAFSRERVYLTIEAGSGSKMMGYLVSGRVAPDLSKIEVDTEHLVPIEPQAALSNKADETLLLLDDRIVTFYEVNGAALNPHPVVHIFNLALQPMGTQPSPSLEYRVTDAARVPGSNHFWVINAFFLPDIELLPQSDPLAEEFGKGPTHSRLPQVERLVEMQYDPNSGISLVPGVAPVQLQLETFETRNWEGLTLLDDRGFLMATDKYPATLLGFVPFPK